MLRRAAVVVLGGALVMGGLGLAILVRPAAPTAVHVTPAPSSRPASSPSPTATADPEVAGAATVAPDSPASSTPASTASQSSQAANQKSAPANTVAPVPSANLTLVIKGVSYAYRIATAQVTDACNILTAAKAQGFITSVTLDDQYRNTLHSAYVREINGYENNWTFKVNGASPKGCSLATVTSGDTVTWTYQ